MKYYYRKIYVINGELLEEPRVEIYRINSNGVVIQFYVYWFWFNKIWFKACNLNNSIF